MSEADWDLVLDTNLKGAFNFIQAVERTMLKQRSGRIINIASVAGIMGNAGQANYAASKAGLIGLTKVIARELASRGITSNAVAPGFISTDMTESLPEALKTLVHPLAAHRAWVDPQAKWLRSKPDGPPEGPRG
jgi:3-oxoacyl-[acyl-carrier protein] reductase